MSFILRLTIAVLIFFLIEFYYFKRTKNSLLNTFPKWNNPLFKKIFKGIIIWGNVYPVLLVLYFIYLMATDSGRWGPIENSFFDYLLIYPFWVMVLTVTQSVIFMLPIDIIRLIFYPFYKKKKEKVYPVVSKVFTVLIIGFAIYVPARMIYDHNTVWIRESETEIENLHPDLEEFKITFIADTQADWYTDEDRLNNFIDKVNSTNPDLVLMAGDVITSTPNYIDKAAKALGRIKSKHGIYTCIGDHDNWAYRGDLQRSQNEVSAALNKYGIEMFNNENKIFTFGSAKMKVSFATYTYSIRISEEEIASLAQDNSENDLNIFLIHQVNEFLVEQAAKNDYDLFLAGHTHGGQITLLYPFLNLTPTISETNYIRGDYFYGNMKVIVTPGLGMSIAPVRYNSTPEVTVITLQNEK